MFCFRSLLLQVYDFSSLCLLLCSNIFTLHELVLAFFLLPFPISFLMVRLYNKGVEMKHTG